MPDFKTTSQFVVCTSPDSNQGVATRAHLGLAFANVDEADHAFWRGIIDARHLQALQIGKQSLSQFGYGVYTVRIMIVPTSLTGSDNHQHSLGYVNCEYVMPTPARFAALAHLKTLEKMQSEHTAVSTNFDGELHPLLAQNVDQYDMAPGSGVGAVGSGNKGAKVIRFAFDGQTNVYGQGSYLSDLDQDGDFNSANEEKFYQLLDDGPHTFGILDRYETNINPLVDTGVHQVDIDWNKPLASTKVKGKTLQMQPVTWSFGDEGLSGDMGVATTQQATFTNVEALGGIIKITFPDFFSRGDSFENNDFEVWATVTQHKWVPMSK